MMQQVYVAGSYSADTRTRILQNISAALVAACMLTKRGYFPIVPHTSGSHHGSWDEAEDCIHPDHHHQVEPQRSAHPVVPDHHRITAEDFRALDDAMGLHEGTAPPTAQTRAEQIRRDVMDLLKDIDAMDDPQAIRPSLEAIYTRLQFAYTLLDEVSMSEAG